MANDPRFSGNADVKAVKIGSYWLIENALIGAGSSTSDFISSAKDGMKFLNFYLQSTGNNGGDARGMYMRLRLNAAGTGGGEAVRAYTELAAAYTTGGTHGIHATLALLAAGSQAGLAAGGRFTLAAAAATKTLTGTYASLLVDSDLATGNTVDGQKVSFVRFADVGAVAMPYLFDLSGLTAADSAAAVQADTGAVGSIYGYARVICPGGAIGYLVIYSSHS